jgi:tRNA 2-selenouridine synthase
VGNLAVPAALIAAMHASPCLDLQLPTEERVALLLEDYAFFLHDRELFCERLQALTELRGKAVVDAWKALVHAGRSEQVVRELLTLHYDPGYAASIRRNFDHYGQAQAVLASDHHEASFTSIAQALCAQLDHPA